MPRKGATLELAVLGLLQESPLHGYELRKRLNLLLGWTRLLSYGSLYPALKRMLRAGWITEVTATNAVSRRQRIVYQITPAGIEFFTTEITEAGPAAWEDETFNMRFAFFSRTDAGVRLRILEGRRSRLQERLDRARTPVRRRRRPLRQRAAPALDRVGRARGALAHRADRGRARQRRPRRPQGRPERPDSSPGCRPARHARPRAPAHGRHDRNQLKPAIQEENRCQRFA